MDDSKFVGRRIRPKARPLEWSTLNLSQQEAFRRIVYTLNEAVSNFEDEIPANQGLIFPGQNANTAFLSGSRGTGKTSVLLTLMRMQESPDLRNKIKNERLEESIDHLNKRLIWTDPIDMDPLPQPFSLVTTILEGIRFAIKREIIKSNRGGSNCVDEYGFSSTKLKVDEDFERLVTSATLAWDSNVEKRKDLQPDQYALEVARTNKARQRLNRKISEVLTASLNEYDLDISKPLVVVPVDDFDMHPSAALRVLKMLRMISVPRIFFLMLGDISMLELMADISVSREICDLIPPHIQEKTLGFDQKQVGQTIGSISRTTLRKVLPPAQRFFVEQPGIAEGMRFRPSTEELLKNRAKIESKQIPTLLSLMGNVPFSVFQFHSEVKDDEQLGGHPTFSMFGYLVNEGLRINSGAEIYSRRLSTLEQIQRSNYEIDWKPAKNSMWDFRMKHFGNFVFFMNEDQPEKGVSLHLKPVFDSTSPGQVSAETPKSLSIQANSKPVDGRRIDQIINEKYFWGNGIFSASPRVLSDLWFLLRLHADRVTRSVKRSADEDPKGSFLFGQLESEFIVDFARFCKNRLLEEDVFDAEQRQDISTSLTPYSYGDFNWSSLPVKLVSVTGPSTSIPAFDWARKRLKVPIPVGDDVVVRSLYLEFRSKKIRDWSFIEHQPNMNRDKTWRPAAETVEFSEGDPSKEISKSSASSLMILHDFLQLGTRNVSRSSLIPDDDGYLGEINQQPQSKEYFYKDKEAIWCRWAGVRYKGSYRNFADLYWPPPTVLSFWGLDMFRRYWNRVLDHSEQIMDGRKRLEVLAFSWISGSCALIEGKQEFIKEPLLPGYQLTPEYLNTHGVPHSEWSDLSLRLARIAKNYFEQQHEQVDRVQRIRSWLQSVIAMVMPEGGLPIRILFALLLRVDLRGIEDIYKPAIGLEACRDNNLKELDFISERVSKTVGRAALVFSNKESVMSSAYVNYRKRVADVWLPPHQKTSQIPKHRKKHNEEETEKNLEDLAWHWSNLSAFSAFENRNPKPSKKQIDQFHNYIFLAKGLFLVRFMEQNKTEIRARRGARLSRLIKIGEGHLAERLMQNQCLHLADSAHSDLEELQKAEFGKCVDASNYFLLGDLFAGGGLVPHEDEVPGLAEIRREREKKKTQRSKDDLEGASLQEAIGAIERTKSAMISKLEEEAEGFSKEVAAGEKKSTKKKSTKKKSTKKNTKRKAARKKTSRKKGK